MEIRYCLFLSACLAAAGSQSPAARSVQVKSTGAILLQKSVEVGHLQDQDEQPLESIPTDEIVAFEKARAARFLIRASFGPTRATLSSIQGITHEDWIAEQVALPIELHRSYYRQHANPHFEAALSEQIGRVRSPCASESRWRNFAFIARDVGKSFELRSGKLFVDGRFRSDVQSPPLASQWWGLGNTSGFLCAVEEAVGGDVQVASDEECRQKTLLPNLRAWSTSSEHIASLTQVQKVRPGVYIGDLSASSICAEAVAEAPHMARHQEHILIFEERLELLLNTPEKPIRTARACVPRNEINEDSCRLPTFAPSSRKQQGLSVKVWRRFDGDFLDLAEAAGTLTEFAVPNINFSNLVNARFNDDFPLQWHYAAHFSGTLRVEQEGTYDFFLSSDDGSRLTIDGKVVVNNGGYHGFRERTGSSTLPSGEHSIHIDYFQGDYGQGLILEWSGPDSSGERQVVPAQQLSTMVRPFEGDCYIACGSPGEGSNEPAEGHQFAIYSSSNRRRTPNLDQSLDNRYTRRMGAELTKSAVWVAKALGGQDQMRQRMAWALSQIFVVSVQGLGLGHLTEPWLAFYDIFVRAAMGNFWSILQEVTYNPLMGKYLTHTGSSSYAYNQNYPNENYAREVMQLFSIGLDLLKPDGTPERGPDGHVVPSYSNEQILNFARVFTGFVESADRDNIESERSNMNLIDPMFVRVDRHDIYPKPDLDGNYLGDTFPSCLDVLPAKAFLDTGARYEFRGFGADTEDAFELTPDSSLFKVLCASDNEAQCSFSPVVELKEKLDCTGAECEQDTCVREVAVAGARFVFRPPVCVHRFFHDSVAKLDSKVEGSRDSDLSSKESQSTGDISTKTKSSATTFTLKPVEGWKPGYCVNADSARVWTGGGWKLDELDGSDELRKEQCVAKCRQAGGTGCEMIFDRNGHGCYVHMSPLAAGSGLQPTGHLCWVFDYNQSALLGHSYQLMPKSTTQCPDGTRIETVSECREAVKSLGLKPESEWTGNASWARPGCSLSGGQLLWNFAGQPNTWSEQLCRAHIVVDQQGLVGLPDGGSSLAVRWIGGTAPAPGTHLVSVTTGRLFDSTPSLQALQSQARIGSYTPSGACFACEGEVRAHGEPGTFDEHTVFEANGQFYKNIQSIVSVIGGGQRFRNPPVFLRSTGDQDAERSVHAEIRTLLEHLFHHGNTPVFVSKRLIQRFTTSNPSPQYLSDVSMAFRSGEYDQLPSPPRTFSGAYGDLAATAAAILLHPEADELTDSEQDASFRGALREPVLKFMHFMRAMEYEDVDGQPVVFRRLQDVIGQFPYESPTVFNFYSADYELPMNTVAEPEPEAEEEEEEEEEEADKRQLAVSPEFQIFTPAFFVGYLNGMSLLTRSGVSEDCAGGDGTGLGIRAVEVSADRSRDVCPQGRLLLPAHASVEETIAELDVLLTGGRLTPVSREMVRAAAKEASQKDMLQAAQLAVVMTAEFNTLGKPLPLEGARPELVQEERPASRSYRAAVMLFFGGGADTFNLLVPMDCPLYDEYLDVRTDLALQPNELGKISTTGQPCSNFGIHGRFPFLRSLYTAGEGAFVSNVGNLVRPTTLQEHQANQGERCFGLFSHSDQQNAAQTMKCQDFGTAARGAGGRIADALSSGSQKFSTTSFSLAGAAIWSRGFDTQREIVDERDTVGFSQYETWRQGIHNITAQRHGNAYAEAYATAFLQAIETTENLGRVIDGAKLKTAYPADSQLGRQLRQVAKLIQTHDGRAVERDFFFVSVGGWDHHSNMKEALASKFQEVDDALKSFVAEMKQQGNWDKVVLFTSSEFGRTLDSNGGGSDHAWAGNHFVIGGGIKGGRVLNSFPSSLAEGSPRDLGRGRLIPEFPWESMLVPIASWMGVEEDAMGDVFPNLGNFDASHLIPTSELFEA